MALTGSCSLDGREVAVQPLESDESADSGTAAQCAEGTCDAGVALPSTPEEDSTCLAGDTQCVGATPRTCAPEGDWVAAAPCSGELPVCVPETASCVCREGTSSCASSDAERRCTAGVITQSACDADSVCEVDSCTVQAWTRQFGAPASSDFAHSVSLDGSGNVLVAGITFGALPEQTHSGGQDSFARKYGPLGNVLWTRQFGIVDDNGFSIFVITHAVGADGSGNVLVAGQVGNGSLPNQLAVGGAFLRKYGPGGNELWTRQFVVGAGTFSEARSVQADASGNVLVAGNQASGVFVTKHDSNGGELWSNVIDSGFLQGHSLSVDAAGNVLIAGPFVRKYDPDGGELWTIEAADFGGSAQCVDVDGAGNVLVVGNSGDDVFVRKYDPDGNELWTSDVATALSPHSLSVDTAGNVLVAGNITGALPGYTALGEGDAFVKRYDAEGNEVFARQFGTSAFDRVFSVRADAKGNILLAGQTSGALSADSILGGGDAFVLKLVE